MAVQRDANAYTHLPKRVLRSRSRSVGLRLPRARSRFGTPKPALLALACRHGQSAQKLNFVTSLRRPKHLRRGLTYVFMVNATFPYLFLIAYKRVRIFSRNRTTTSGGWTIGDKNSTFTSPVVNARVPRINCLFTIAHGSYSSKFTSADRYANSWEKQGVPNTSGTLVGLLTLLFSCSSRPCRSRSPRLRNRSTLNFPRSLQNI